MQLRTVCDVGAGGGFLLVAALSSVKWKARSSKSVIIKEIGDIRDVRSYSNYWASRRVNGLEECSRIARWP